MMQLYVKAKSKKELNERLRNGEQVHGVHYTPWGETKHELGPNLENGTVIKVYDRVVGGSPYAKAYGQWDVKKLQVK